ncbi:MAG: proton-conducting transporter transmembrane domain-containing protein, partial [Halobacteriota archaeon]
MYILYTLVIPLITAALCALSGRNNARMTAHIAVIGMTISAVLFSAEWFIGISGIASLDSIATAAGFSAQALPIAYVVTVVGAIIAWYSMVYMGRAGRTYYPLLLLIIGTTAAAVLSVNLATFYILFEIGTLSTAFLVTYRGGRAFEAATKFIVLNSIGSSFALIALILMFVNYGTLDIASFGTLSNSATLLISLFLFIG